MLAFQAANNTRTALLLAIYLVHGDAVFQNEIQALENAYSQTRLLYFPWLVVLPFHRH